MPLKLHAIEDWSRKRLVSELGSARFDFDPPMNLGSRSTYLILSSPSVRIACFLPFLGPMMQTERSTLTRLRIRITLRSSCSLLWSSGLRRFKQNNLWNQTETHMCTLCCSDRRRVIFLIISEVSWAWTTLKLMALALSTLLNCPTQCHFISLII